jgi:cell division transport system permease protein
MRLFRSDLPLAGDASGRFLPWIICCMVYLAALALAAALAADNLAARWHADLAGRFTVEVPPAPASSDKDAKLRGITDVLAKTQGVTAVRLIGAADKAALLQPWLGGADLPEDIVLPDLIVVESATAVDMAKLSKELTAFDAAIRIDDHGNWHGDLLAFSNSMKILALIVLSLVALAAISTVIFVTRTGLAIHRRVIEIVHLVGAQDSYIARQFLFHALRLGLAGGAVGAALAAGTWIALQHWLGGGGSGLLPSLALSAGDWIAVAAVPIALSIVAMFTAQITVLILLGREP